MTDGSEDDAELSPARTAGPLEEIMRYTYEDGKLTLYIEGRIDTANAPAVLQELHDILYYYSIKHFKS